LRLKWFIPAGHDRPELTSCEACGSPVRPVDELIDAQPDDGRPGLGALRR